MADGRQEISLRHAIDTQDPEGAATEIDRIEVMTLAFAPF